MQTFRGRRLTADRIIGHSLYQRADYATYTLLLETLLSEKFTTHSPPKGYAASFPNFDKVFWRPDVSFLAEGVTFDHRIPAAMVVHQGVHTIFSIRYGTKASTDIGLVLLAEAMATAINYYFLFRLAKNQRLRPIEVVHAFRLEKRIPWIKEKFLSSYLNFDADPVNFFYQCSVDILRIYEFMLTRELPAVRTPEELFRHWYKLLGELKQPWLGGLFEAEKNVLYVRAIARASKASGLIESSKRKLETYFSDAADVDQAICNVANL